MTSARAPAGLAWARRILASVGICLLLTGCPDPNTYGTPRTLEPGRFQLQVSLSGYGGTAYGSTHFQPALPSVGGRIGLTRWLDLGARLVDFGGLGSDAKFNFLRGRLDMAIDPTVQTYYLRAHASTTTSDLGVMQLHLPLLLGVNFNEDTTLLLTPGFVATLATTDPVAAGASTEQTAAAAGGIGARMGIGINFRASDKFSWQPEVTAWHDFSAVSTWVAVFGVGINLGDQPDYSELGETRSR